MTWRPKHGRWARRFVHGRSEYGRRVVIAGFAVVLIVVLLFVWGAARRGGDPGPQELDPRTSRRQMDKQYKKPPNEGGLL
jgi:hypothetical protein